MLDGAAYEGQFKNGKKHGVAKCAKVTFCLGEKSSRINVLRARYTYANGAVYEGEYKEARLGAEGKTWFECHGQDLPSGCEGRQGQADL